jgi:hypothetical protein
MPRGREEGQKNTVCWPGRVCENCGFKFDATRSDAKTCSTRCRVELHRAKKQGLTRPAWRKRD